MSTHTISIDNKEEIIQILIKAQNDGLLKIETAKTKKSKIEAIERVTLIGGSLTSILENITDFLIKILP
jgi:hypothetical protein